MVRKIGCFMSNFLNSALTAYNSRQYNQAILFLNKCDIKTVDWYILLAATYSALNQNENAEQTYSYAVNKFPSSLPLIENYTNLLCRTAKHSLCLNFLKNTRYLAQSEKVSLNFIESLIKNNQLLQAKKELSKTLSDKTLKERYHWLKLELLERLGDLELVESYYLSLPADLKNQFLFKYKRACNFRNMGKFDNALDIFLMLSDKQNKYSPEVNFLIGCTYYDLLKFELCEQYLKRCLEQAPNYIPAHECLNKLYWDRANKSALMSSYNSTFLNHAKNPQLVQSQLAQLLHFKDFNQALDVSSQAIRLFPDNLDIKHAHGIILGKHGQSDKAFIILDELVSQAPQSARYSVDLANYCIENFEYKKAILHLNTAVKHNPFNQEIWAYLATAWRLAKDDKYHWLTNYDMFVKTMALPTPKGYKSFDSFGKDLKELLLTLHTKEQDPLDQSVRRGSQTEGHLLYRSNTLLSLFKQSMESCISTYLNDLPADSMHPLTARNSLNFTAKGSWSVKLENGGYHANHIHPHGWLSAPSYISIPDEMSKNDPLKNGWLKLGETCLDLGKRESIDREICPESGQIIIFPSYIWHGTNELKSDRPRLTIPSDIMPIG